MKFSIIIPVYNAELYLREALCSILKQTYDNWECICIDDGSVDGSPRILDDCYARDSRFQVLHQRNAGVSAARNRGLELAKGDYVCFLDADDTVEPDWLLKYAQCLACADVDVVRVKRPCWDVVAGRVPDNRLKDWCWHEWVRGGYPWTYAIRRELATCVKFPIGVCMSEDELYLARLVPFVKSAYQLADCAYIHRVHQGSAMTRSLSSQERLTYLRTLEAICYEDDPPFDEIGRMASESIVTWMNRWQDSEHAYEIREIWRRLEVRGYAKAFGLSKLYRITYAVYAWTGLLWPGRLWSSCVRSLVNCKRRFFCR